MPIYEHLGVRPRVGREAYIAPGATVIGDVTLGDESSVWFGTVVHVTGDAYATTVGDDVTIGHMALLHGCTVGSRVLVGMGSILLDGCEIGDECIVGAGSLIAPRAKIPPRSLVMGRPGKVVRPVSDEDLVRIRVSADLYVGYAKTFADGAKVRRID